MIFNPAPGALLDYEQVALERGSLSLKVPATMSYTLWLAESRVATTDDRP